VPQGEPLRWRSCTSRARFGREPHGPISLHLRPLNRTLGVSDRGSADHIIEHGDRGSVRTRLSASHQSPDPRPVAADERRRRSASRGGGRGEGCAQVAVESCRGCTGSAPALGIMVADGAFELADRIDVEPPPEDRPLPAISPISSSTYSSFFICGTGLLASSSAANQRRKSRRSLRPGGSAHTTA